MLLVAGVDPGVNGAVGLWDVDANKLFSVIPLPHYTVMVGKMERTRLDEIELVALFKCFFAMGVKLVGIENVQGGNYGGKKQSASGAFQFGYTFGLLRMAALANGMEIDAASPAVWKLREQVPASAKGIVLLADKAFPEFTHMWHGPKGGLLHDRADAAFLARYFGQRIWPSMQPREGLRTLALGVGKDVPALKTYGKVTIVKPKRTRRPKP